MEEEAARRAPWKVISAALIAGVVILASLSAYLFLRPEAEEISPICPTNYEWDPDSVSCILSDTFAPTGVSEVSRGVATIGEVLTFDGGDSTDDVAVAEWIWDFGDGTGVTGKTVDKAYYVPGDYIVSLVVKDAAGNEGTNEALFTRVRVLSPTAPQANETAPLALVAVDRDVIEAGDEVFADGNGSWRWKWTDGAFEQAFGSEELTLAYDFGDGATASGSNATHTYTASGNYALRLTATGSAQAFYIHTIHVLTEPAAYVGEIKNPDTMIRATIAEAEHLDPAKAYDSASGDIIRSLYEPLVMFDRDSLTVLKPMLASQVPTVGDGISADGLTYTFPIRQGVKFHNGDIMDAADVEYSFERMMISDITGGPAALLLQPLVNVTAMRPSTNPDPANITQATFDAMVQANVSKIRDSVEVVGQDVIFTLQYAFPPFLGLLSGWGVMVMNKDYLINEKNQWPMTYDLATIREYNDKHDKYALHGDEPGDVVGTGPFTLKSWDTDVQIVIERFDDYWQGPAKVKTVVTKMVTEWGTRKLMFLNGDVDFIDVPQAFREQVIGEEGVTLVSGLPRLYTAYATFFEDISDTPDNPDIGSGMLDGNGIPPTFFADEHIRRAFSWLFDYDTYIEDALQGLADQPIGPIPKPMIGYTDAGPKYSLNLAKAEAEFKASSWMPDLWDLGFKFTMSYNVGNDVRRIASEMIRDTVKAINPKFIIDIQAVEWGLFLERLFESRGTIFVIAWGADYPDPHNFAYPFMHSAGFFPQFTGYTNATVDAWIDEAGVSPDPAFREDIYFQMQEAGFWDPPGIWLYQPVIDRYMRSWVQGWWWNEITEKYWYDYWKA